MSHSFTIQQAIAVALACACMPALAAGTRVDVELSLERDGNPARAETGQGVPAEFVQTLTIRRARSELLDERSGWVLHGEASVRRHDRYHALNELDVGGGAVYRIQPEVGFTAPWYELAFALDHSMRSDSALRNVTRGVIGLATGANLTDRVAASAGVRLTRALADSGTIADQRERALDLEGSYLLAGRASLYARWTLARGDQMFSSSAPEYGASGIAAEAADRAFGPGFVVYRSRALTRVTQLGVFIPTQGRQGWNVWGRAIHSATDAGSVYSTLKWGVDWRYLLN